MGRRRVAAPVIWVGLVSIACIYQETIKAGLGLRSEVGLEQCNVPINPLLSRIDIVLVYMREEMCLVEGIHLRGSADVDGGQKRGGGY